MNNFFTFLNTRISALFSIIVLSCFLTVPSYAEDVFDIKTLSGRWVGEGRLTSNDDKVEKLWCRVTFLVREGGKLEQNIRCKSDTYQLEVRNNLIQTGEKISGDWADRLNELKGTIEGSIEGQTITALVKSKVFDSELSVVVKGDKQVINLRPINGIVKLVSFDLARG